MNYLILLNYQVCIDKQNSEWSGRYVCFMGSLCLVWWVTRLRVSLWRHNYVSFKKCIQNMIAFTVNMGMLYTIIEALYYICKTENFGTFPMYCANLCMIFLTLDKAPYRKSCQPWVFIRAQIKENSKAPRHWPLCEEFTGDRWIPRTNGQ